MSEKRKASHVRRRPPSNRRDDDDDDQPRSSSQTKRRRQAAVSLTSFSSKKGHDRALQEFKKRKETNFNKNAVLLREYQRAMKQEGYEVGRGASRKRGGLRDEDVGTGAKDGKSDNDDDDDDDDNEELQTAEQQQSRKKRHKSDPLHRAKKEAESRKAEQLETISQKEQRQQNESKKQQDRRKRAKKMMRRTKRGQPLMKNVIGDMLGKIKSDVADGGI